MLNYTDEVPTQVASRIAKRGIFMSCAPAVHLRTVMARRLP
jgi:hypothetical protein